jgi:hypothetical protein
MSVENYDAFGNGSDDFEIFGAEEAKEILKGDILAAGDYPITIIKAEMRSKELSKWIALTVRIEDPHEMSGRVKTFTMYIQGGHQNPKVCNIHAKIRQSLDKALGMEKLTLKGIIGQSCMVKIKNSEKDGNVYENIDKFFSV